jgi:hypothetical protein
MTKTYTPATRADLKPGARFVVTNRDDRRHGQIVALDLDDGTDAPWFRDQHGNLLVYHLSELAPSDEPSILKPTIEVPADLLRAFVGAYNEEGWLDTETTTSPEGAAIRKRLRDFVLPLLPPTEDPELVAAREKLEAAGYTVSKP